MKFVYHLDELLMDFIKIKYLNPNDALRFNNKNLKYYKT